MEKIVRRKADPDAVFLESAKKRYLQETYEHGIRMGDGIRWESYEDATILPAKPNPGAWGARLGVLDREGSYIAASRADDYFQGGYPCGSFDRSDRRAAYCGCDRRHWGHFLVNVVPCLWVALELDGLIEEYVMVRELDSGELSLSANQMEFFRLLGILDKVRVIDTPTRYRNVIVPEASYQLKALFGGQAGIGRGIYYRELLDTYGYVTRKALAESGELAERKKWEKRKKVFFSRPRTEEDVGIEAVDSFFVNNGYHIVYAEQISLVELVYYLHSCDSVAYLSGTLQHNMLFAPEGRGAVALERRLMLSLYQTDIDLMKDISATYVNVQYSIMAGVMPTASGIYAYTEELREYGRKLRMSAPDYGYTTVGFLQKSFVRFLGNFIWRDGWAEIARSNSMWYHLEALSEDIGHIERYLPGVGEGGASEREDTAYWKHCWTELLLRYHVPYRLWNEEDQRILIRTFSSMIERSLDSGKRGFLIFPYGANGMLFEDVLRRRYGICPRAIFDNHLSKYHPEIKRLEEIEGYLGKDACIVLTTRIMECRRALERYCDIRTVESPFSIV